LGRIRIKKYSKEHKPFGFTGYKENQSIYWSSYQQVHIENVCNEKLKQITMEGFRFQVFKAQN
jgi:hypothetical protein